MYCYLKETKKKNIEFVRKPIHNAKQYIYLRWKNFHFVMLISNLF